MNNGNIPVITVEGKSLAETYEKALLALHEKGQRIKTQYDNPKDPASIDATMNMTVLEPLSDPMIHKCFVGGISDLREYVYELEGLKDCICRNENDPKDTRWEYLYSSRMTNYGTWLMKMEKEDADMISCVPSDSANPNIITHKDIVAKYEDGSLGIRVGDFNINQVDAVVEKLTKQPFTRQAQMITWMPNIDLKQYDPPCLQSLWFRITTDENGKMWLNTNIRFRSNDAYKANFMNFFGFIQFIDHKIRQPVEKNLGKEIGFGRINWQADSFHIYGKDIADFETRFLKRVANSEFSDRVYEFYDEYIQEMYHENENAIVQKFEDIKHGCGIKTNGEKNV